MFTNKRKMIMWVLAAALYALFTALPVVVSAGDIEEQYKNSLNYYEKIKSKSAGADELISVLKRIVSKYESWGFDLTAVKEELKEVKVLKGRLSSESADGIYCADFDEMKNYRIEVGDMLSIIVPVAEEYNRDTVVQPDGKIVMKTIGEVLAKGLTKGELASNLVKKLSFILKKPTVDITIKKFSRRKVYMMGEIKKPGSYDYENGTGLLGLINRKGGATEKADFKNVKLYRGEGLKRKVIELNLEEVYKSGDFSKDYLLEPGDVVEIGKSGKEIYVIGEVNSRGSRKYIKGIKLLELITISGGFTDDAVMQKVKVFRGESPNIEVYEVNMSKVLDENRFELDIELEPGDTVYVPKKSIAKVNVFIGRFTPWFTLFNFGMMVVLLAL